MSNFIHIYIFVVIVDFTPCFPINITVNKIQSSSVVCNVNIICRLRDIVYFYYSEN
jgi:hypothetical protein